MRRGGGLVVGLGGPASQAPCSRPAGASLEERKADKTGRLPAAEVERQKGWKAPEQVRLHGSGPGHHSQGATCQGTRRSSAMGKAVLSVVGSCPHFLLPCHSGHHTFIIHGLPGASPSWVQGPAWALRGRGRCCAASQTSDWAGLSALRLQD